MRNRFRFSLGSLAVTLAAVVCAPAFVAAPKPLVWRRLSALWVIGSRDVFRRIDRNGSSLTLSIDVAHG